MRSDDRSNLLDIYEAAKLIRSFVSSIDRIDFEDDLMRQSAIIRQLEVIGEASKCLSLHFRNSS